MDKKSLFYKRLIKKLSTTIDNNYEKYWERIQSDDKYNSTNIYDEIKQLDEIIESIINNNDNLQNIQLKNILWLLSYMLVERNNDNKLDMSSAIEEYKNNLMNVDQIDDNTKNKIITIIDNINIEISNMVVREQVETDNQETNSSENNADVSTTLQPNNPSSTKRQENKTKNKNKPTSELDMIIKSLEKHLKDYGFFDYRETNNDPSTINEEEGISNSDSSNVDDVETSEVSDSKNEQTKESLDRGNKIYEDWVTEIEDDNVRKYAEQSPYVKNEKDVEIFLNVKRVLTSLYSSHSNDDEVKSYISILLDDLFNGDTTKNPIDLVSLFIEGAMWSKENISDNEKSQEKIDLKLKMLDDLIDSLDKIKSLLYKLSTLQTEAEVNKNIFKKYNRLIKKEWD